ncbi:MAG TPA: serine/threonine-protein kinase [Ktedonobacteraceae bacterium]|nr:serine/threonine-protein kinase [Ktedonobacteraceae bacterium]
MLQEQMTLPVGATVQDTYGDRYRIKELLGRGGFGAVYLVNDRHMQEHEFALKELIEPSGHDHERLLFECEILKKLDHPALPRVYHVFEYEKLRRVYLLMEYIKGRNLEDVRDEQPEKRFPWKLALAIMTPIVDALTYLHQQEPPIVHRDIKPDNIIVPMDGGEAVLVDFGTAKEFISDGTTTVFRHGSPGYAPIEQYSPGSRTNLRTDVYGLGATLYTLLTGKTPVDAIARLTAENGKDPLKPVSEIVPDVPRSVSNAIQCALSIYNQHRFSSVAAFWEALHNDSFELPEPARPSSLPETPLPAVFDSETGTGTPLLLGAPQQIPLLKNKKVRALALAILMLLALGLGSLGIFLSATHHPTTSVPRSTQTHTPQATASPSPSATPSPISNYPQLAQNYAGTIGDSGVAGTTTNLYLSNIKQNQGQISGNFNGLYQVGTFTGTVSTNGNITFKLKIATGFLICTGTIKVGGELQGAFKVVDPQGNSLGEYGLWTADPTNS